MAMAIKARTIVLAKVVVFIVVLIFAIAEHG
jgi:hypothetical protein